MNKLQIWFRSLRQKLGRRQEDSPPQIKDVSTNLTSPIEVARKEGARPLHGYSLRLIQPGPDKENVIHFLQEYTGMSLAETRALLASVPCQVIKELDPYNGRALLKKMEMLGATCELVSGMAATPDLAVRLPGPFDVILIEAGPNKAQVIQMLRDLLDTANIIDAERLVEVTPKCILTHVSEETAVTIKTNLENAGATVKLLQTEDTLELTKHPDNSTFLYGDYDIILEQTGLQPDQVVQTLRDLLNYRNLIEIEQLALYTPSRIIKSVPWETAVTIKTRLENVGATITITAHQ